MWARSLHPSRLFATPARALKDRLDSRCLLPLTGFELRCSELHRSELHPQQQKQIQPQHAHEMPITRSGVQRAPSQVGLIQLPDDAHQAAETAGDVQSVSYGQHVEKGIADVAGESESLGSELHPGKRLPGDKEQAQE